MFPERLPITEGSKTRRVLFTVRGMVCSSIISIGQQSLRGPLRMGHSGRLNKGTPLSSPRVDIFSIVSNCNHLRPD
jgi:hypothetical protein